MSNKLVAGGFSQGQVDRWRQKIKVGHAIAALNLGVMGKVELSTARMKAIEVALRKALPDLSSVDITTGGEPVRFTWAPAEQVTIIDIPQNTGDTDDTVSDSVNPQGGLDGVNSAHTSAPEKGEDGGNG